MMKNIFYSTILIISTGLISCTKQVKVYGLIEDANGISEKTDIKYNGLKIAQISKLDLIGSNIYATISLEENILIPKKSKFITVAADLLGNKEIEVKYDSLQPANYLIDGDTIFISKDNVRFSDSFKYLKDSTITPENKIDSVKKTVINLLTK